MNIPRSLLAFLAILTAAAAWYFGFRSTPEDQIVEKLDELAEVISTAPSDGLLGKAKVISSFQKLFSDPVVLETNYRTAQGIRSPKELAAGYLGLVQSGQTVSLRFTSPTISFPLEDESKVKTTVEASLSQNGQAQQEESRVIYITLGKDLDGEWKFERFSQNP